MMNKTIIIIFSFFCFVLAGCSCSPTLTANGITVPLEKAEELVKTIKEDSEIIVKGTVTKEDLEEIANAFYVPMGIPDPTVLRYFLPKNVKIVLNLSNAKGIREISDEFSELYNLKKIILPLGIKKLGKGFNMGTDVKKFIVPSSVTEINNEFAPWNQELKFIEVSEKNKNYSSYDGVLYSKDMQILICCPASHSRELKIHDGTKTICTGAFFGCKNLEDVIVPESVTKIEQSAFFNCNNLRSVTLPSSIQLTEDNLSNIFYECERLSTIYYDGETYKWE